MNLGLSWIACKAPELVQWLLIADTCSWPPPLGSLRPLTCSTAAASGNLTSKKHAAFRQKLGFGCKPLFCYAGLFGEFGAPEVLAESLPGAPF